MASGRLSKVKGKILDIPTPPTIGTATAGGESVSIAFTADSSGKGGPTRSYIAKSNPGNITATGSTSPISVTGLTAGTSYTISVAGVNETGTGEYSSASGSAVPTESGNYEPIATVTVGSGGTSSIEFASIPQTYVHLQIRGISQQTNNSGANCTIRYNNDSGSNYNSHYFGGNGASVGVGYFQNASTTSAYAFDSANNGNNAFSGFVIDIFDYSNTNKNTTNRSISGWSNNSSSENLSMMSGMWRDTSAVTNIKLQDYSGGSFAQYSHFALYGIQGA